MNKIIILIEIIISIAFFLVSIYLYGFNILWLSVIGLFTALLLLTYEDIKTKMVSTEIIILFSILGFLLLPLNADLPNISTLIGTLVVVGIFFLLNKVTKGAIGLGDVGAVGLIFIYSGIETGLYIIVIGIIISGLTGLVLLTIRRVTRKTEMPFIPFLLFSYIISQLML